MSTETNAAEQAEYDALLDLFFALQPPSPGTRCFCGSIEDLRRVVAELEAQTEIEVSA